MLIYKKKIPIYFGELIVVVNNDFNESFENFKLDLDEYKDCQGLSYNINKNGRSLFFIFLNETPDHSTIAHECLHIAHYILYGANHTPDYTNDEPECYLHDYIIGEVYKFLNKNKVTVKI